ncbi:hypothetical protein PUN28_002674 [Cardiocondyla obscurior]|uniref:Uncharacterized protein n=1 Tax=Cardiocondyla obscurior TaxID=286306 RepID=A0AAW2GVE1_9HYME
MTSWVTHLARILHRVRYYPVTTLASKATSRLLPSTASSISRTGERRRRDLRPSHHRLRLLTLFRAVTTYFYRHPRFFFQNFSTRFDNFPRLLSSESEPPVPVPVPVPVPIPTSVLMLTLPLLTPIPLAALLTMLPPLFSIISYVNSSLQPPVKIQIFYLITSIKIKIKNKNNFTY